MKIRLPYYMTHEYESAYMLSMALESEACGFTGDAPEWLLDASDIVNRALTEMYECHKNDPIAVS